MLNVLAITVALLLQPAEVAVAEPAFQDRVGDAYEVELLSVRSGQSSDGSTNRSRSGGALVERVVATSEDGLVLEFDHPSGTSAMDRARDWTLPARVYLGRDGSRVLLNEDEVRQRIDAWLALGEISREACGSWIFTWTAFKIECDPQAVLETLDAYILRPESLREGASFREPGALAAVPLAMRPSEFGGRAYTAQAQLDPDVVRRERAEMDVIIAPMLGQEPVTLEDALTTRSGERISGSVTTTFETDEQGRVVRRVRTMVIEIVEPDGVVEQETRTVTVRRRPMSPDTFAVEAVD